MLFGMAGDTDFLVLYEELGLAPGVSDLDAFKQAYRRRVAQLHPDRQAARDGGDPDRLQRLNRLYGAAMAFEQRYGRLPAASAASRRPEPGVAADNFAPSHGGTAHERRQPRRRTQPPQRRSRARYYFALVILLALAFAIWGVGVATR